MEQDMELFYDIAFEAIKKEDLELRRLFRKSENNQKLYDDEHKGICCLYETTFVYQIFKALMDNDFKYRVVWELPYECNSNWHSDLGLKDEQGITKALIEFKIWNTESSNAIHNDIDKLRAETSVDNKYIFVIEYGGDPKDDLINEDLKKGGTGLKLVPQEIKSFKTLYRFGEKHISENNINVYMYKV